MANLLPVLVLFLSLSNLEADKDTQSYNEDLILKHLPDGRVLAHFEHVTRWNIDPSSLAQKDNNNNYGAQIT